eukprot:g5716.t1
MTTPRDDDGPSPLPAPSSPPQLIRQRTDDAKRALVRALMWQDHAGYEKMGRGDQLDGDRGKADESDAAPDPTAERGAAAGGAAGAAAAAAADDDTDIWVATEKVHGANFSFVSDGHALRCASRKRLLGPDDDFFGCRSTGLVADLEPKLMRVVAATRDRHPHADVVWVFGELFGGGFPGHETQPGALLVQGGIFYSHQLEFMAFDIAWAHRSEPGLRHYVSYREMQDLGARGPILCAETLFEGTKEAALAFPYRFDSTLPVRLGLPKLPAGAACNLAEGTVVRPRDKAEAVAMDPETARKHKRGVRAMFKNKISEFGEISRGKGEE